MQVGTRIVCTVWLLCTLAAATAWPRTQSWIGVTRKNTPIKTLLSDVAFDYSTKRIRILIVAGLDGSDESKSAAREANRWFQSIDQQTGLHKRFSLSLIPNANPDAQSGKAANGSGGDLGTFNGPVKLVDDLSSQLK